MKGLLHITNGDSFTERLEQLPIQGDIITWREMLCEGKTISTVGSESFWKTRFEFLNKNYKVSKSWFIEKTLKEYRSLCNYKQHDKIVLWFEYDLFCQINMLAVISWLKTHRRHAEISLVCSGKEDNTDHLYALNELTEAQLMHLYDEKQVLSQDDIEYADYVWQLYCSDNPIRLENLTETDNSRFQYLSAAIEAHLKRFPKISNGLDQIESDILQLGMETQAKNKRELISTILSTPNAYGYGDTQYDRIITSLKPLFSSLNPVRISKKGKEVLEERTNYYALLRNNDTYLGGALKYNFLYNSQTDRILKL